MQFLSTSTSTSVPRVHCSLIHNNRAYIAIERTQGPELANRQATPLGTDRKTILAQLRRMLDELRSLTPPDDMRVQNCAGGSLYDLRISYDRPLFGLFQIIQEFHC